MSVAKWRLFRTNKETFLQMFDLTISSKLLFKICNLIFEIKVADIEARES